MCFLCGNLDYKMKNRIALCLSLILLLGMTLQVNAAGALSDCTITISCQSNGIGIDIQTEATEKADEIGCKNIILVEKNGNSIKKITIPDGYKTKADSYGDSYVYTGAVKGRTYYAYCTHYAIFNGDTRTADNSTREMVYN